MAHSRRGFLVTAGLAAIHAVALGAHPRVQRAQSAEALKSALRVVARRNYAAGRFYFDPAGLYVDLGQTVRWENSDWGFNVTAFHPEIDNHELRIPEGAHPFDSGLMAEGASFEWTFRVEGTYDYYSRYHETIGAVGRIVVVKPGGPAEKPPGYGAREGRAPMFKDSIRLFELMPSRAIVGKKRIPYPIDVMKRPFPSHP